MTDNKLKRYEYGELAGSIFKGREGEALLAMNKLYQGFDLDKDDPVINRVLAEAAVGISQGQMTSSAVFEAMTGYAKKFNDAYKESTVGEFVAYVGYKGMPDDVKALLEKHSDKKIGKLSDKGEQAKVRAAVNMLRNFRMEGDLYPGLIKEETKQGLESLVKKK